MQILLVPIQKEAWDIFNQEYALGYIWKTLPRAAERIFGGKIDPIVFFFFFKLGIHFYSLSSKLNERKFSTHKKVLFGFLFTFISCLLSYIGASLVAQLGKNLLAMPETQVCFLGRKDPLEKEMATHSRILAWKISWTEEPGGLQSMGSQELDTT